MLVLLLLLCLVLVCGYALQARIFYKREEEWRARERQLVDRLLRRANVEPLEVQRSKVLQLDDDPTPNKSPADEAFELDEIKEELEQLHPNAAWMSPEQAKSTYLQDWNEIAGKLEAQRRPLRIE